MSRAHDNGSFTTEYAKRKRWKIDEGLAGGLVRLFDGSTVCDMGAGVGRYVEHLQAAGIHAVGMDGTPGIAKLSGGRIMEMDLSVRLLGRRPCWDWVLSLETGEHIPPDCTGAFLDNVADHAILGVVISWATPGQRGVAHVNCRAPSWVRAQLERRGFQMDQNRQAELHESVTDPAWRRKLWVLTR